MGKRFLLLAFDSFSAITAGCLTLLSASLILVLYKWQQDFTLFMGLANLGYGFYSGFLAFLLRCKDFLRRWMVILLIFGNGFWSIQCFFQAWRLRNEVSYLGIGHLIIERVFVGLLACLEARFVLPSAEKVTTNR